MILRKDIVITLDDNKEYGVTETELINDIEYVLMINIHNRQEMKICKVVVEEQGVAVIEIDNSDLNNVMPIFYIKARRYLEQFLN